MSKSFLHHKEKLFRIYIYVALVFSLPTTVFGGAPFDPSWVVAFIRETHRIAGLVVPLLLGIALLVFIWGILQFLSSYEDKKRAEGKRRIVWGLISLFAIVSVWGLIALLQTLIGIRGAEATAPQSYFGSAPSSGAGGSGGNSCATTGVCSDSFWSCYSPCCPDIYDPVACRNAGG